MKARISRYNNLNGPFPFIILFFIISFALFNSFLIDKHFATDGVNYFRKILDSGDFVRHDWSRMYAIYLTQWPLVLAVKAGIKDVQLLSLFFALGIYLNYLISFLLCVYILRGDKYTLLLFPILSMIAINLPADYHLSGEFPVMVLYSWPVLFLILKKNRNWKNRILLWILLIVYSRLYQSSVLTSLIFAGIIVYQLYKAYPHQKSFDVTVNLFLLIIVFGISFYFIIFPYSIKNERGFFNGLKSIYENKEVVISLLFILFFYTGLLLKKNVIVLLSLLPVSYYLVLLFTAHHGNPAIISFQSRTLSVTLLPVLLIGCFFLSYRNYVLNRITYIVFLTFVVIMVSGNIRYSEDWKGFKKEFTEITQSNTGFIHIQETALNKNKYQWPWTNSMLSIVWGRPCVKSIILNIPRLEKIPFDPRDKLILKQYIRYDRYFLIADSNIMICEPQK